MFLLNSKGTFVSLWIASGLPDNDEHALSQYISEPAILGCQL